uniref:Integrase catalytic domain-containing protein n=1 Tax=Caenorhabditis tropicalis TaxID=1561998 RepID=A0A1I7TP05_9PELO
MALSHRKGHVTRACNTLTRTMEDTTARLEVWLDMSEDELIPQLRDIIETKTYLQAKMNKLEDNTTNFAKEVENITDDDEEAQQGAETMFDQVATLTDQAQDIIDKLFIQERRAQQAANTGIQNMGSQQPRQTQDQPHDQGIQELLLEQIKIAKFKGDEWEFENFWLQFSNIVDKSQKPKFLKFNKLLALLEKYNNKEVIISKLTSKLQIDSAATTKIQDQRKLFDRLLVVTSQLETYGETIDTRIIKDEIVHKFSGKIQDKVFDKKIDRPNAPWTLKVLCEDLENILSKEEEKIRLRQLDTNQKSNESQGQQKNEPKSKDQKNSQQDKDKKQEKDKKKKKRCVYCKEDGHWGHECETHSSHQARLEILKKEDRCVQCTKKGHMKDECKMKPCFNCKKAHHSSLCLTGKKPEKKEAKGSGEQKAVAITTANINLPNGFIPTIQAEAFNPKKMIWEPISMMLDSGADTTYITKELRKKWELLDHGSETLKTRVFNSDQPEEKSFGQSSIRIKTKEGELKMEVYVAQNLTGRIPKSELSQQDLWYLMKNRIQLNPEAFQSVTVPDMILGCDYWHRLVNGKREQLPSGIHVIETEIGFTTMGRTCQQPKQPNMVEKYQFTVIVDQTTDQDREAEDKQKWDTQMCRPKEFTGPAKDEQKEKDKRTLEHFEKNVEKREEGYFARIPFKENHPALSDNKIIAVKRLEQLKKQYSPEVLEMINNVFKDYEEKGFIEKIDMDEKTDNLIHYNALQAVITPSKTTTKCRIVVDASSHFKGKPSLNDIIEQGPCILPDIVDVLIRFRSGRTVLISDVEKAFLQIFLHEDDRDITRVIWLKDIHGPVTPKNMRAYRFTRVLFGLNVSPFILAATIIHHLKKYGDDPIVKEMPTNLYVDNLIITTDEKMEEVIKIYKKIKTIFYEANMNIREFLSNSTEVNDAIEVKVRATENVMKVLGIQWTSETDTLKMEAKIDKNEKSSRRTVAKALASIFDPLGMLVPLVLQAKLFQRELWNKDQYGWDDASKEATACCVYVKNSLGTNLILGKCQARPLKEKWTIPKLEMHSTMTETRKTLMVLKALKEGSINIKQVTIITDSTICLAWLKTKPSTKEIGTLVMNRIMDIQRDVKEMEYMGVQVKFGHVRSEDNPADLGTRGCTKQEFADTIWWKGPRFLQGEGMKWTENFNLFQLKEDEGFHIFTTTTTEDTSVFDGNCTNSLGKMSRIAVYVLKFVKIKFQKLSPETLRRLEEKLPLLKNIKANTTMDRDEFYAGEKAVILDHQKTITKKHLAKHANLGIIKNEDGLLVCKGRMELAELEKAAKEPILVLPKSTLAKQIIWNSHGKFHNTTEHTMDVTRRRFWIPTLRQQVKSVIGKCSRCQRFNKQPFLYPDMGRLPQFRVRRHHPFENTGLDNFGPFTYKKEDGTEGTAFGTIFTCTVTRLVHIEVVQDTTAQQFVQAFRRFVALRGTPKQVVSDNGTNFVLGQKIIEEAIKRCPSAETGINWKFITPYSPWKGGVYERMVQSVKHAFLKAIGRKILTLDELATILYETAASTLVNKVNIP